MPYVLRRPRPSRSKPVHRLKCPDPRTPAFQRSWLWRRLAWDQLHKQPLCEECLRQGRVTQATDADHIKSRFTHPELAADPSNIQSLCSRKGGSPWECHDAKTAREKRERQRPRYDRVNADGSVTAA